MIASLPIPSLETSQIAVYFIFRDSSKTPVKLVLNLLNHITVDVLISRLGNFFKIDENVIDLCLIHDRLINEVIPKDTVVKQLNSMDGIIFAYEKSKKLNQNNFKDCLNLELIIEQKTSKKADAKRESVVFTRLISVDPNTTFLEAHLTIYEYFKHPLANFINEVKKDGRTDIITNNSLYEVLLKEKEKENGEFVNEKIDLKEEFDKVFADSNNLPFTLFYEKGNTINLEPFPLSNERILDNFNNNCKQIKIHVILNSYIVPKELKMNTCASENHTGINDENRKKFTLSECLALFSKQEKLDKDNEWYCNRCKDHKQATKKMEIYKLPSTLILHLKRFKTSKISSFGSIYFPTGSSKINSFIDFPLEMSFGNDERYRLIGVCNHYGQMNGGHYTAFCKNYFDNKWYEFDDISVTACRGEKEIFSEAAYMLFYQKVGLNSNDS